MAANTWVNTGARVWVTSRGGCTRRVVAAAAKVRALTRKVTRVVCGGGVRGVLILRLAAVTATPLVNVRIAQRHIQIEIALVGINSQ